MRVFFDTNVVVYAFHQTLDLRHETASHLLSTHVADGTIVLSTQVLQETFSVLTTKKKVPKEVAASIVTTLALETVVPSNVGFVLEAIKLAQRYQLSIWDALMIEAAFDSECDVLLSEDMQAGMRFGKLEIVNPFRPAAHQAMSTMPGLSRESAAAVAAPTSRAKALHRPRK